MTGTEKDCAGSVAGKEWKRTEENGGVRMERRSQPIGFMIKQINNVFEKELNEKVKSWGLLLPSVQYSITYFIPVKMR